MNKVYIKRILAIILILILLCFVGCGNTASSESPTSGDLSEISSTSDINSCNAVSSGDSVLSSNSLTNTPNPASSDSSSTHTSSTDTAPKEDTALTAKQLLATMSIEEKVAQLFIIEPEKLLNVSWGVTEYKGQDFTYPVGGVIFFADNIKTPTQATDFITALQAKSEIPMFIAVDEEGGNVARIAKNPEMSTTAFPPMKEIKTENAAYNVGNTIGREIKQFGFNLDLAPVADVADDPDAAFMKGRSFGSDPEQVSKLVASCVGGFKSSGILCTLKHFPGKGNSSADSHFGYSELNKTLDEWRAVEKPAFKAGIDAGADFVMVGHYAMPKITGNEIPATISPALVNMLREELSYDGLLMTDSLSMGAITDRYDASEVGVLALEAGIDVLLMPENLSSTFNGIISALRNGRLTEERIDESVLKILKLKYSVAIIK